MAPAGRDNAKDAERVRRAYARRWRTQVLLIVPLAVGYPLLMWASDDASASAIGLSRTALLAIGAVSLALVLLATMANWRCPACNVHLGHNWNPRFCPSCGVEFRGESEAAAARNLSPAQLWGLAAGGVLTKLNGENFTRLALDCGRRASRLCLRESWGIEDAETLQQTIHWLSTEGHSASFNVRKRSSRKAADNGKSLLGWDLSRLVCVARWAYTAGYIGRDEAWRHISDASNRLQAAFGSWDELAGNFRLGFRFWNGCADLPDEVSEACDWLQNSPDSPTRQLDWTLDLGGHNSSAAQTPPRRVHP